MVRKIGTNPYWYGAYWYVLIRTLLNLYRHRDYGRHSTGPQWGWPYDHPLLSEDIKVFVLLNDQQPDQGVTSIVPNTHRVLTRPGMAGVFEGGNHAKAGTTPRTQDSMEGHVKFTGNAGDAMLFDIRTWHTAMPNTSDQERRSIIMRFSPAWLKSGMKERGFALEKEGHLEGRGPMMRQLLGMGLANGQQSYFADDEPTVRTAVERQPGRMAG